MRRSSCLNYPHRLGFVLKRSKKRLRKADPVRRFQDNIENLQLLSAHCNRVKGDRPQEYLT